MTYILSLFNHEFYVMSIRIFIAAVLCGVIGFEREINKHPAGFRTHLLVGVGSCLMMLMSLYGFEEYINQNENIRFDPARIPSYVISGIGFLGAGTILVKNATIRGLTTAASIWVVAGIGLIVGVGMYAPAVLTTVVVLLSLIFLNKFEEAIIKKTKSHIVHLIANEDFYFSKVVNMLEEQNIPLKQISIKSIDNKNEDRLIQFSLELEFKNQEQKLKFLDDLIKNREVKQIF